VRKKSARKTEGTRSRNKNLKPSGFAEIVEDLSFGNLMFGGGSNATERIVADLNETQENPWEFLEREADDSTVKRRSPQPDEAQLP
jgi:hypothetical protein